MINNSCGGQGCEINPYYFPQARPKKIFQKKLYICNYGKYKKFYKRRRYFTML